MVEYEVVVVGASDFLEFSEKTLLYNVVSLNYV